MGAIILTAGGTGSREPSSREQGFAVLRAPAAEPAAQPLTRTRAAPAAPPVPAPSRPGPPAPTALPGPVAAVHPDAHRFVLSTLRPVFEVLDRRRPAKHLTAIATGTVVDVMRTLAAGAPPATRVTGWGRVHVGPTRALPEGRGPGARSAAEIHLTYERGDRVLAAAGRVECEAGQWHWVAFTTVC